MEKTLAPADLRPLAQPNDDALFTKVNWHLLPLLITCYVIAYLDRINIGFAQLQMKHALPFSDAVYAAGAGIFFVGYFLFEVPSNLILERIGARKTLLRIMVCWGLCAAAMIFVQTPMQFYALRFALGAFEAGFFPGVILYLTYWYPSSRRAKAISTFMVALPIAGIIAGPASGWLMKFMDGVLDLHGWQWLFVVHGLPAPLLGIVAYFTLKDRPEDAAWLTQGEKHTLRRLLSQDTTRAGHGALGSLLRDPKVYLLSLTYFLFLGASYAVVFWTPTLIKSWGVADVFVVGLLAGIPAVVGAASMVLVGRSSDRHQERRRHFACMALLAALGLFLTIFAKGHLVWSIVALAVVAVGKSSTTPLFFAAVSEYVPRKTAAGGIALISSLGNLGPSVMPSITTWITGATGSPVPGLAFVMALYLCAAALLMHVLRHKPAYA